MLLETTRRIQVGFGAKIKRMNVFFILTSNTVWIGFNVLSMSSIEVIIFDLYQHRFGFAPFALCLQCRCMPNTHPIIIIISSILVKDLFNRFFSMKSPLKFTSHSTEVRKHRIYEYLIRFEWINDICRTTLTMTIYHKPMLMNT